MSYYSVSVIIRYILHTRPTPAPTFLQAARARGNDWRRFGSCRALWRRSGSPVRRVAAAMARVVPRGCGTGLSLPSPPECGYFFSRRTSRMADGRALTALPPMYKVTGLQSYTVTRLHGYTVTKLHSYRSTPTTRLVETFATLLSDPFQPLGIRRRHAPR